MGNKCKTSNAKENPRGTKYVLNGAGMQFGRENGQ